MRLIFFILLISFGIFKSFAQESNAFLAKKPFKDGELIKYELSYGPITGGYATGVIKKEQYEGKEVFHASMIAKTSGLADILFNIKDIYESNFDAGTCFPYKSIRNVQEGSYKEYIEVDFDQGKKSTY